MAKNAEKNGKGKKAAAEKVEKSEASGKRAEVHGQKIKVLAKENPRREGTAVHAIFAAMKTGQTVGEFLAATEKIGGKMSNLRKAESKGWISLK